MHLPVVKRALVIQHEPNGGIGTVGHRLGERGYELETVVLLDGVSPDSSVPLPDPTAYDLVVSLGSIEHVYEEFRIGSWINREVDTVRTAHEAGVPVLGICFGTQVLAAALGGAVELSPRREIGWMELDAEPGGGIEPGPWMVWHIDRVVVPPGATELARTDVCNHAYRIGRSLGVQFHPEVDEAQMRDWIGNPPASYWEEVGVDPEAFLDASLRNVGAARDRCARLVDWFLDDVAVG